VALEPSSYKQSPMDAERVQSGALPPLEERLPVNPLILPPLDQVGKYGGDMNTVGQRPPPNNGYNIGVFSGQCLVFYAWGLRGDAGQVVPNIAESFEINEDATRLTINLRKGLKWSDGAPFTTEDMSFYWDSVMLNDDLSPSKPNDWKNPDGTLIEYNPVDTYTAEFTANGPKPWLLDRMASYWSGGNFLRFPAHFMQQFHADFAKKADLDALVKEGGFNDWKELFWNKRGPTNVEGNPDKPYTMCWLPTKVAPETPPWIWERNPYFWATDIEGQQLPYINRILHTQVAKEVQDLKSLTGEMDYVWGMEFSLLPELLAAEEEGKIRLVRFYFPGDTMLNIQFNLQTEDEVQRAIYEDKRFRIAVSQCINREEISTLNYYGTVGPQQPLPPKGTPTFEATRELGLLYTEYDPDKANALLDEMGLDQRSGDGWRLRPDGQELQINFICYAWEADTALVTDYMKAVGINTTYTLMDTRLYWERVRAVDWDASTIGASPTHPYLLTTHRSFLPEGNLSAYPLYARWYTSEGREGVEPAGLAKESYDKWLDLQIETDPDKQLQIVVDLVKTAREEVWTIGTNSIAPTLGSLNPAMKNLPAEVPMCWDNVMADVYRPEILFYDL